MTLEILFWMFAIFAAIGFLLRGVKHKWEYRNPYDRTCSICGRHEVSHCEVGHWNRSWWEEFREGDISKHKGAAK